ncbi:MAG: DNA mismatch repair protein MutS, partial [Rhodospirillaceae bacterium]|nr:DNA mismatch repair protein MutS [Rhodospirillaceae bacterium]
QVAKLAGLPPSVIERAEVVLSGLEDGETLGKDSAARLADDLPLFAAARPASGPLQTAAEPSAIDKALAETSPDSLTPREALDLIYRWKAEAEED